MAKLNALQMGTNESTISFVQRFQRSIKELQDVSQNLPIPPESELISLLIGKCLDATPTGADVRNTLLFYDRLITHHIPDTPLPFTLSALETDLCQHDTHLSRNTQYNKYKSSKSSQYKANATTKYQRKIECLKCKGNHKLIHCSRASEQEKRDLWEAFKKTWTTKRQTNEQANSTKAKQQQKSNNKNQQQPTTIKSRNTASFARHWASMTQHTSLQNQSSLQHHQNPTLTSQIG